MNSEEQGDPAEAPPEQNPERPAGRGPGLFGLLKAVACIAIIVLVEILTATMVFPSGGETEELARRIVSAGAHGMDGDAANLGDSSAGGKLAEDTREVELGNFSVTRYNPSNNRSLSIDFALYGTVLAEDSEELATLLEENEARIGEQVIMTLHAAEVTDLTDAGLALIKRRILEKTNRALGRHLLREVLFSNFNFVER